MPDPRGRKNHLATRKTRFYSYRIDKGKSTGEKNTSRLFVSSGVHIMLWDVYLGGISSGSWRSEFKEHISNDITIFDPTVDDYNDFEEQKKVNQTAKQLDIMREYCAIAVFYFNASWNGASSLMELGEAIGGGKHCIVCVNGNVNNSEKIRQYCEYHGVPICSSVDELILTTEEFIGELAIVAELAV